jgi:hypothetical protein
MLRYTRRFLEKFKGTPFFSFTWLNSPFHDDPNALGHSEDDLLSLFQFINSNPSILSNTLIIFTSDHGNRYGEPIRHGGMEGFLERGLPPLFIRIPERLREMYPSLSLDKVMEKNSKQLVSPFDLHHTFLHLLKLTGMAESSFEPVLTDRSSLFLPIELMDVLRNCENLHISPEVCTCNTFPDGDN